MRSSTQLINGSNPCYEQRTFSDKVPTNRADEREYLLHNVLLARKGCAHCKDKDSATYENPDEKRQLRGRDRSDYGSKTVPKSSGALVNSVGDRAGSGIEIGSLTKKMEKDEKGEHGVTVLAQNRWLALRILKNPPL